MDNGLCCCLYPFDFLAYTYFLLSQDLNRVDLEDVTKKTKIIEIGFNGEEESLYSTV